jgi:hypothetical protein
MAKELRWRLVEDEDGHWYVIPADKERDFDFWVEATQTEQEDKRLGTDFEQYRLPGSPSNITFVDPKDGSDGVSICQQ